MRSLAEKVESIIRAADIGKSPYIIAIDGRCASGKTTLANMLGEALSCNVIHTDDFFLRPEQRTEARLAAPGENLDHERLLSEVLLPLSEGKTVAYRPFDCKTMSFAAPVELGAHRITVIEGAYSCHASLRDFYSLRIFLSVPHGEQMRRIRLRGGESAAKIFEAKWIPLEEKYFAELGIEGLCDYSFTT